MKGNVSPACAFLFSLPIFPPVRIVNNRARRRWALLYTLLKNPHLILLRKRHLSSSASLQTSSSPQSDSVLRAWVMASQTQSHQAALLTPPEIIVTQAED